MPSQDTQKRNVSFYVLSENKAQDFLGFICQLTQTALNKSSQSVLILADSEPLLNEFDSALWSNEATSFIPHQRLDTASAIDSVVAIKASDNAEDQLLSLAPVLLGQQIPTDFSGIVINTTSRPVNDYIGATSNAKVTRMLEIIKPDAKSVEQGRTKYKSYQQLGYELSHFKV